MGDDWDLLGLYSSTSTGGQQEANPSIKLSHNHVSQQQQQHQQQQQQQHQQIISSPLHADPKSKSSTLQCSWAKINHHSLQQAQPAQSSQLVQLQTPATQPQQSQLQPPTTQLAQQENVMLQFDQFDFFNQQLLQPATRILDGTCDDIRMTMTHTKTATTRQIVPSPLATNTTNSVASLSNQTYSILDDRAFAPPPPLPTQNNIVKFQFHGRRRDDHDAGAAALPSFEKVMHSGKILARISIKSLITRSWKEVFWIIYGSSQLLIFRCMRDYEDWLLNPCMSYEERDHLVKLKIDLEKDLNVNSIRGYQCTDVRPKSYRRRGVLYQFKIDSMTPFGPSLVGAFGSSDRHEVTVLYSLLSEMLKRSVINSSMLKLSFSNKPLNTPRSQSIKSTHSQWSASAPSFALSPSQRENSRPVHTTMMTPKLDSRISTLTENF